MASHALPRTLDAHFWDWMLSLHGKEASRKRDVVATELQKLFDHLLHPLGVDKVPSSIAEDWLSLEKHATPSRKRSGASSQETGGRSRARIGDDQA